MKNIFLPILFALGTLSVFSQNKFSKLQSEINALVNTFQGEAGYYIEDLSTGKHIGFKEDSIFPTASIVKIPIMVGILNKMKTGDLQYHQKLTYKDSLLYEGEDILGSFKDGEQIELSKVLLLMLSLSDNTASLWLQSLAGGGQRINQIMEQNGFENTRVNSRTPDRRAFQQQYGWGQTTPLEMANLLKKIYSKQLLDSTSCQRMMRLLGRNYWDEEALSEIPPGVFVASKSGAVNASRSEVLLVNGKHPYLICIFTKNNTDQSWATENEAWAMTRKISALAWKYFSK